MNKEGRNICGKVRTCKVSGDKIIDVYDSEKKIYVPYNEFIRQQEEYKTNRGKKISEIKETTNEIKDYEKEKEDKKTNEINEDVDPVNPYEWYVKKVFKKSVILCQ